MNLPKELELEKFNAIFFTGNPFFELQPTNYLGHFRKCGILGGVEMVVVFLVEWSTWER